MPRSRTRTTVRLRLHPNAVVLAKRARRGVPLSKRARGIQQNEKAPFVPPEDWHPPGTDNCKGYKIIVQPPGAGYRHVLTPGDIRRRLAALPARLLEPLEVVQLSRITRKKQSFPCYGMQWGSALYLYPIETDLVETYHRPPVPAEMNEARMFGGRWVHESPRTWKLVWTEATIRDFYLNNILIHELGHLLDERNSSYVDRERFAEWFAIEHGYKRSRRARLAEKATRRVVRRHHGR